MAADVYYKIVSDTCYYSNYQEDEDYALKGTTLGSEEIVTNGKYVEVILNEYPSYSIPMFIFPENASGLFMGATNTEFPNSMYWSVGGAKRLLRAFYNCTNLTHLDCPWDTSSCITFQDMFTNCTSLKYLDLKTWTATDCKTISYMFRGCTSLGWINIENFIINKNNIDPAIAVFYDTFEDCTNLRRVYVRDNTDWMRKYGDITGVSGGSTFTNCISILNWSGDTSIKKACTGTNEYGLGYFSPVSDMIIRNKYVVYMKTKV